jgi:hypothetical protein
VKKRLLAAMLVAATSMTVSAISSASSAACNNGPVPSNPTGLSAKNNGAPTDMKGSVVLCNNGAVLPSPFKASGEVGGDANAQTGYVYIDGDSNNTGAPCTDGFFRLNLSSGGATFSEGKDGAYTSTSPKHDAQTFATNTQANCQ